MVRANNKGQVYIVILILTALAATFIVLTAIYLSDTELATDSADLASLASDLEFNHRYVLAQSKVIVSESIRSCPGCTDEQLKEKIKETANKHDFKVEGANNIFGRIRNKEFSIVQTDEGAWFQVDDTFVQSLSGENKLVREFDICMTFFPNGDFESYC